MGHETTGSFDALWLHQLYILLLVVLGQQWPRGLCKQESCFGLHTQKGA
jgi:hypothetical protein